MEEHGEGVDVVGLAPRRQHVLGQLVDVPLLSAVSVDVDLEVMPVALNDVRVRACYRVNETDPVVHGMMRVTLAAEIIVSRPTIAYDRGAWFDPSTNDGRQSSFCFERARKTIYQYRVRFHRISTDPVHDVRDDISVSRTCSNRSRRSY